MLIDNVEVVVKGYDDFSLDELKNYVAFVKKNVAGNVTAVTVKNSDDGFVDLNYTVNNPKFERIRRITGKEIAVQCQAV